MGADTRSRNCSHGISDNSDSWINGATIGTHAMGCRFETQGSNSTEVASGHEQSTSGAVAIQRRSEPRNVHVKGAPVIMHLLRIFLIEVRIARSGAAG